MKIQNHYIFLNVFLNNLNPNEEEEEKTKEKRKKLFTNVHTNHIVFIK